MKNDSLFRTSMVGGYNKDDVKAYIEKLEKEIERLRSVEESAGLLEKSVEELLEKQRKEQEEREQERKEREQQELERQAQLPVYIEEIPGEEELKELKEKAKKYDESYDAVKQLLLDSRIESQMVLENARQQADQLLEQAKEDGLKRKNEMEEETRQLCEKRMRENGEQIRQTRIEAEKEINRQKKAAESERTEAERLLKESREKAELLMENAKNEILRKRRESIARVDREISVIQEQLQNMLRQMPAELSHSTQEILLEKRAKEEAAASLDEGDKHGGMEIIEGTE